MPVRIDGKKIAADIIDSLKQKPAPQGFIAIFTRPADAAASSFVKQKEKTARELGIELRRYDIQEQDTNDTLRRRVRAVAHAKRCIGVILQLPLPTACNPLYVANAIPLEKNIDRLGSRASWGHIVNRPVPVAPAVRVVQHIIGSQRATLKKFACIGVVGQGVLVGGPVGTYLQENHSRVRLFDKGFHKKDILSCDLLILGTGSPGLINGKDISPDAWVIDFGYGMSNGVLRGDFDAEQESIDHIGLYTPTPGGTGPILVASLFENLYI